MNNLELNQIFAPKDGLCLSGAGQSVVSILEMVHSIEQHRKPVIIALYDIIRENGYTTNPDIREAHNFFPGAFLQIGLQFPVQNKTMLRAIGEGKFDQLLNEMARNYQQIKLPVYLRIGYEFDGEWNDYDPFYYKLAYRRVVDIFRENDVKNVVFVWNSYQPNNRDMFNWYPDNPITGDKDGDDYVDWFSYNIIFSDNFEAGWYLKQAAQHNKPVMIGESSYAIVAAGLSFEAWIKQFFQIINRYKIKGYQYINWNWHLYPEETGWKEWKIGRYTDQKALVNLYNSYLQQDSFIFRDANYYQPVALFIHCARNLKSPAQNGKVPPVQGDQFTAEQGYSYQVENVKLMYNDGFNPYWQSVEDLITLKYKVPEQITGGNIFFNLFDNNNGPDWLEIAVGNREMTIPTDKKNYIKIPFTAQDINNQVVTLSIKSRQGRLQLEKTGMLIFADDCPRAPEKVSFDYDDNLQQATLNWSVETDIYLYNIYKNNSLYVMTDQGFFVDKIADQSDRYSISSYSLYRGEGPMLFLS
ncbi:MAG: glycoside hydrolase family 26 protein [Halanaerobiales bacterium]|nr:glycoside hydrolase family 26 protein [Halanaerobiales bacterium]